MCNRNSEKVEIFAHGLRRESLMRKVQDTLDLKEWEFRSTWRRVRTSKVGYKAIAEQKLL